MELDNIHQPVISQSVISIGSFVVRSFNPTNNSGELINSLHRNFFYVIRETKKLTALGEFPESSDKKINPEIDALIIAYDKHWKEDYKIEICTLFSCQDAHNIRSPPTSTSVKYVPDCLLKKYYCVPHN